MSAALGRSLTERGTHFRRNTGFSSRRGLSVRDAVSLRWTRWQCGPGLRPKRNTAGLRVSDWPGGRDRPWCEFVIKGLGRPIASSSANLTGEPTPNSFNSISPSITVGVDFVSSHRKSETLSTTPSFMVAFDKDGRFKILRK